MPNSDRLLREGARLPPERRCGDGHDSASCRASGVRWVLEAIRETLMQIKVSRGWRAHHVWMVVVLRSRLCRFVRTAWRCIVVASTPAIMVLSFDATAQPDPHAGHHPPGTTQTESVLTPASPPAGASSPGSDCTGGMMECMQRAPAKQLYPQLMELPALTAEARAKIEHDARSRIAAGTAALAEAQSDYHQAMIRNDAAAMSAAMSGQRVALGQMESGTAALRALAEGHPPKEIALTWFRDQMDLSPAKPEVGSAGAFGISWFHLFSMAIVAGFALVMAAGAVSRRRRSLALVNQLTRPAPAGTAVPGQEQTPAATPSTEPPPSPSTVSARPKGWAGILRVAAIVRETPQVKTFRLVEPAGGPIDFTFIPGQFLTFSSEVGGKTIRRSYTIASPPSRNSYVEITVKREHDGEFSRFLHDRVSVGDTLRVSGPSGVFTFDGGGADSIVLIAGGVGITPMMCVIRHLTDQSWPGEIFLVFAMRSTEEFIFREELEYLQRRHPRLHVTATVGARSEGTSWMGLEGPIAKDTLVHAVPNIAQRRVHLCGPPLMMEAIRTLLKDLDVPPTHIKTEAFGPATGLAPPPKPSAAPNPPLLIARLLEKADAGEPVLVPPTKPGPATAMVSFVRSRKSAPMPPDKSVLEVAEAIGVPIDYSCRVGTCGICKTKLLSGQVTMEVQDALSEEEKAAGTILACQAHALRDIAVDA